MNSSTEKLYRAVYAAIVGSRLTSRELRRLVELLSSSSEFSYVLQKDLWEFAESLDHSFARQPHLDFEPDDMRPNSTLSEVAISRIQSDKMSKASLMDLLYLVSRRLSKGLDPKKHTMRQLVEGFLEQASAEETADLFQILGIDVAEDPYLGGIDRKTGRGQ